MTAPKPKYTMTVSLPSEDTIVLTRKFDAPRDLVYETFTKPEHIRQWWGCDGSELTTCEMDFRVGGKWRYVTAIEGKGEFAFNGIYRNIDRPDLLAYTSIFEMFPESEALESIRLSESDGTTTLTCTATYPSREVRDQVIASGMESGASQSYDRLEALLKVIGS